MFCLWANSSDPSLGKYVYELRSHLFANKVISASNDAVECLV